MRVRVLLLAMVCGFAHAQRTPFWEFPNFSDRVQIQVSNPLDVATDGLSILRLSEIQKVAPAFPGTLLLATDDGTPAHYVETEADPPRDEFSLSVHLEPRQTRTIFLYYSTTLRNKLPVIARVYAAHSYGYNRATAALESERIGYRTYGAFMLDVQAHAKSEDGLFNGLFGFASIHHPLAEGHDVVHTGDTLGLGGLFVRSGAVVYRPPFSTPDYTHRPPKSNEPSYRVIVSGPLRAVIEEALPRWKLGNDSVSLRAEYEIDAGQEVVHCHWWIKPLHVSRTYEVGAGIRDLDPGRLTESRAAFATAGIQQPSDGTIALGLAYTRQAIRAGTLPTPEADNQIIVFSQQLTAANPAEGEYVVGVAWSGSGWSDPQAGNCSSFK
jgi:hypothetical protein